MKTDQILQAIFDERQRQKAKWGHMERRVENPTSCPFWKGNVLGEEMGEVNKAVVEEDKEATRKELIHVAAVAVAWLESIE